MDHKKLCLALKIFIWMYVIPCVILVYVSITLNFDTEQVTVLFFVYLFITTVFNVFIAKNICCKDPNIENSDLQSVQAIKTPPASPTKSDCPPSYQDANLQPPPYSLLRYYWKMIHKDPHETPWNSRRGFSINQKPGLQYASSSNDVINIEKERRKIKRYPSSPN